MKLRYDVQRIMQRAHQMVREAKARGVNSPLCDFNYCLRKCWQAAKSDAFYLRQGWTEGGFGFCLIMEG